MVEGRALRSDAARNRAQIMAASRLLLAERGVDVGMDAIARVAGVAVGTLYRHYPTKADLIRAVLLVSVGDMATAFTAARQRIDAGSKPMETLVAALDHGTREVWENRSLKRALARFEATLTPDELSPLLMALTLLIDAARSEGTIRDDVGVEDLLLLLRGIPSEDDDVDDAGRRRWLQLVLRSLATTKGIRRIDAHFT